MTNRSDSWWPRRRDGLILALLARESVNAVRSLSRGDLAWIVLGGGLLTAYAMALLCQGLRSHAWMLEAQPWRVAAGFAGAASLAGAVSGRAVMRLGCRRAWAPWTLALPLTVRDRWRMVATTALMLGAAGLGGGAGSTALGLRLLGSLHAGLGAMMFALPFGAGFAVPLCLGLRAGEVRTRREASGSRRRGLFSLGRLDRVAPAWLAAWAWRLDAGRVRLDGWLAAKILGVSLAAVLATGASLSRHDAVPATLAGTFGGLAIFMMSLRCGPLASPILRTGPATFARLCLRLMLLPFLLSGAYFAVLAGSALAAEPGSWPMSAQGAMQLVVLSGVYAVFALYFMTRPGLAALAFLAAVGDAAYESLEYGRPVYLALTLLVIWLCLRARARHAHG